MRLSSLVVAGLCSALALVNLGLAAPPADAFYSGAPTGAVVRVKPIRTRIHVSASTRVSPLEASTFVARHACAYPLKGSQPAWSLFPCTEFDAPAPRYVREHREISWAGVHFFPQYPAGPSMSVVRTAVKVHPRKIVLHASY